jgi:hypothetical protein
MRVEHGEYWAELSEKPLTWGERNALRSAASKDFFVDFAPALVTKTVTKWSLDTDPTDPASWEPVDPEFGDAVFGAALKLWKGKAEDTSPNPQSEKPSES